MSSSKKVHGTQITIYLRADEVEKIGEWIDMLAPLELTRHEIVKWAIRRFLFGEEKDTPLDGKIIILKDRGLLEKAERELFKGRFTIQPKFEVYKDAKKRVIRKKEAEK